MTQTGQNQNLRGKVRRTSSVCNEKFTQKKLGTNSGLRIDKPATKRPSHGTAPRNVTRDCALYM
jgi:hypothetical protein